MAKVIWLNQAKADLDQIAAYIRQFDPVAAGNIGTRLFDLGESLADFPNRGRPTSGKTREMVTVSPYVLRYRVVGDRVVIMRIRHSARELS